MIVWCGLSNKIDTKPLDENTKSGELISQVEKEIGIVGKRTNLVKYAPLNSEGKLRYPTKLEMEQALPYLLEEIKAEEYIFLLGDKVAKTFENSYDLKLDKYVPVKIEDKYFIKIEHPSYISVYKKKEIHRYINAISTVIETLI